MPLSRIAVPDHLAHDKIRALADAVHRGLVETCDVPEKDLFQLISTFRSGMMIIDPTYGHVRRTSEASIVEILFLTGRTVDQKSRLFHTIAERAMQAGFKGDDVMIALTENAPSDWSLGYGRGYSAYKCQDNMPPAVARIESTRDERTVLQPRQHTQLLPNWYE